MRERNILKPALVALASLGLVLAAGTAAADDTQEAGQDLDVTMTVVSQHSSVAEEVQQEIDVPGEDARDSEHDGARDDEHKSDTGEEHEADAADSHDGLEQAGEVSDAAEHASEHAEEASHQAEDASHDAEEASHDAEEASHDAEDAREDANDAAHDAEDQTEGTAGGGGGD